MLLTACIFMIFIVAGHHRDVAAHNKVMDEGYKWLRKMNEEQRSEAFNRTEAGMDWTEIRDVWREIVKRGA